jgi:glycosyltransferase involved in cell wall biosynthesis
VFAVDLAAELAASGVPGRVVALTPGEGRAGDQLPVPALGRRPMGLGTLRALRQEARSADVVVAHGSRTLDACAVALAGPGASGTPFVYRSIGDPAAWSAAGVRRWRTALLLRRAARVAVLWPGAADTVGRLHGVPAGKIAVIPNGVPVGAHPVPGPDDRLAARADLGLPAEAPVVACIGALSAEKRVGSVIDAVASLPGVHLLVAGGGPERAALEARAAQAVGAGGGAAGRVHFAGVLPGAGSALAAADVVVLASRTEGMPGVLIEAGLAARPCVATAVGGVPAVVEDGVTGVLVPPDGAGLPAALAAALADLLAAGPARLASLGDAARRRCADRFSMTTVAAAWSELLTGLASFSGQ